jgi:hypothetical protein
LSYIALGILPETAEAAMTGYHRILDKNIVDHSNGDTLFPVLYSYYSLLIKSTKLILVLIVVNTMKGGRVWYGLFGIVPYRLWEVLRIFLSLRNTSDIIFLKLRNENNILENCSHFIKYYYHIWYHTVPLPLYRCSYSVY